MPHPHMADELPIIDAMCEYFAMRYGASLYFDITATSPKRLLIGCRTISGQKSEWMLKLSLSETNGHLVFCPHPDLDTWWKSIANDAGQTIKQWLIWIDPIDPKAFRNIQSVIKETHKRYRRYMKYQRKIKLKKLQYC